MEVNLVLICINGAHLTLVGVKALVKSQYPYSLFVFCSGAVFSFLRQIVQILCVCFFRFCLTWSSGDDIELQMQMPLHLHRISAASLRTVVISRVISFIGLKIFFHISNVWSGLA